LIDSFFASRISIESYEAVFLTLPIMGLSTGIGIGLSAAIADLVSKEKELINIKRYISASVILSLVSIAIFLYIAFFNSAVIERVAGVEKLPVDSMISTEFRDYWKVILWTFPMQIFFSLSIQYLTILEKQKTGMLIIALNLLMNILLNYLFTQVFDWGVEGLAYSTMGVFTIGFLISIFPLSKNDYFKKPYPTLCTGQFLKALKSLTILTLMIFVSVAIFNISGLILNQLAVSISTDALIVFAIYSQIMGLIVITTRGFAGGFIIYLGNAIKQKQSSEYFKIYWAATAWIAIANLIGIFLFLTVPEFLISIFDNVNADLIADIKYFLWMGSIIMGIYILPRLAMIGFISVDKSIVLVIYSLFFVTLQIVSAYYLTEKSGMNGLVHSELVAAFGTTLVFIAQSALDAAVDLPILEVGPGQGALTQYIVGKKSEFKAVDLDQDMIALLKKAYPEHEEKFQHQNFLKTDPKTLFPEFGEMLLLGNFPYNISSQIVFKMLDNRDHFPIMIGMFQKEVAQRILSPSGSKVYGVPSVLVQAYYHGKTLFKVSPGSFNPPPKVDSSVIVLYRNEIQPNIDYSFFKSVVKSAFGVRRKMLKNSLKGMVTDKSLLEKEIFTKRPEHLSVQEFLDLTKLIKEQG